MVVRGKQVAKHSGTLVESLLEGGGEESQMVRGFRKGASATSWWFREHPIITLLTVVGLYCILGYGYYSTQLGWSVVDCMYFLAQIVTTVGYGDMANLLTGNVNLLFTAFYITLGLVIAASAIQQLVHAFVSASVNKALHLVEEGPRLRALRTATGRGRHISSAGPPMSQQASRMSAVSSFRSAIEERFKSGSGVDIYDEVGQRRLKRNSMLLALAACLSWVCAGTVFFAMSDAFSEGVNGKRASSWVSSLYFSVVTLCTVGFGDIAMPSDMDKLSSTLFMLVGVPVFANALAKVASYIINEAGAVETMELSILQESREDSMMSMLEFEEKMAKAIRSHKQDKKIDRFEFLAFTLARNNVISMDVLKDIIHNFNNLDRDGSGLIDRSDLK
mmetsp:Transcript_9189/g.20339  ORF Transcript_9189/g.20339 Transcript_9189/m.20339 type:complete len:390 (+) Transcript_9189:115-1284(+)